ncbi:uncharacterized protein [Salminus brasiliensis]|uniref:uncharacterized protein n=1 Tax=Salminus brasiliensis TaxID=930266 RepID=UPI003B838111
MSDIDKNIVLVALSTLTGAQVKPHTELRARGRGSGHVKELTVENYLSTVFHVGPSGPVSFAGYSSAGRESFNEIFVNIDHFFDSRFDYDFRYGSDSTVLSRGGESYTRPWGWYRFALRVLNKYPDGNAWLGSGGWRSQSSYGEWPVSFHGTSIEGASGITGSHYKPGGGQTYGRGIYSSPNLSIADGYSKTFTYNNRTFKVIMQNRINPYNRVKTPQPDYWLIPVPAGTSPHVERNIVESAIRPYGILIKKI